jgi:hypothetical protein
MGKGGYKQGETLMAVRMAQRDGITLQELSRITGKSVHAIRSSGRLVGIKLKSEFNKKEYGSLKDKLYNIDTSQYTCGELAQIIDTGKYTVYSLCTRYNLPLKKANYGSQSHVKCSDNG